MATSRVRALLDEFAEKLEDVLKQDLRDAIERIGLGVLGGRQSTTTADTHRVVRGKGVKRDAKAIGAIVERFLGFVRANPGLRIEQINKQLGTSTKDLALPIRKLISDGAIKTHGHRRSTTYEIAARKTKRRKK